MKSHQINLLFSKKIIFVQILVSQKKIWFKSLCYIQSIFVLLTTVGLSLNFHYCQGNIKSIGIYASAEKCSGEMEVTKCGNHSDDGISKTPCCSNQQFFYQKGDADNTSNFTNTQTSSFVTILQGDDKVHTNIFYKDKFLTYNGSDPPLVVKDLNILYDTFLI